MLLLALALSAQLSRIPDIRGQQPQLAASGDTIGVAFGSGKSVYFAASRDGGQSFSAPVRVAEADSLALGRHRGPRIAMTGSAIAISAITGGQHGDLVTWYSKDFGKTWSAGVRINDVPASAREGLHAMAAGRNGQLYAVWLDLRGKGTKLYGAASSDGGATWSSNVPVYESPGGTICECCHPSVAIDANGGIYAMWRNALDGNRDMDVSRSQDGGRSWSPARKLGNGTWPLNACPMDGGGLALDAAAGPLTVWRRGKEIFEGRLGSAEMRVGDGKDPALAVTERGAFMAWTGIKGLMVRTPTQPQPVVLDAGGAYVQLLSLTSGSALAAWESGGSLSFAILK